MNRWLESRRVASDDAWRAEHRWDRLARYNSECHRGIVHTPEYDAEMAREQEAWKASLPGGGQRIVDTRL